MLIGKPSFFEWVHYPYKSPPELAGGPSRNFQVAVVGGGPVGLTTALTLAQQGIQVVLLEARDQVSDNSRTLAVSRRSVQVLDRLGIAAAFRQRAITRERNYLYHGNVVVHDAPYEQSPTEKYPDISVLQQPWTEKVLLDAVLAHPNIDMRWLSPVVGVNVDQPDRPSLTVETLEGRYSLTVDALIAADGARGAVRRLMGLKYQEIGDGVLQRNFVICDFEMKSSLPVARRLWISPPFKPGAAVILHKQPYDTWRLDYALDDGEALEEALRPEKVAEVVGAAVNFLNDQTASKEWKIVWISAYRPMSRSLEQYQHGRVFFAGDSAHQTPIFGGRGMNQGVLDATNLAWRLGFVLNGYAPETLLDGYDAERRPVILRNLHAIGQATLCMTAPTRGAALMRKAAFDLLPTEPFVVSLIDAFNANKSESLLTPPPPQDPPNGAAAGSPLPDAPVVKAGTGSAIFLHDCLLANGMTGLYFSNNGEVPEHLASAFAALEKSAVPFRSVLVARRAGSDGTVVDVDDIAFSKLAVMNGSWLLVRPDGYVAARIEDPQPQNVNQAWREVLSIDCQPLTASKE